MWFVSFGTLGTRNRNRTRTRNRRVVGLFLSGNGNVFFGVLGVRPSDEIANLRFARDARAGGAFRTAGLMDDGLGFLPQVRSNRFFFFFFSAARSSLGFRFSTGTPAGGFSATAAGVPFRAALFSGL